MDFSAHDLATIAAALSERADRLDRNAEAEDVAGDPIAGRAAMMRRSAQRQRELAARVREHVPDGRPRSWRARIEPVREDRDQDHGAGDFAGWLAGLDDYPGISDGPERERVCIRAGEARDLLRRAWLRSGSPV